MYLFWTSVVKTLRNTKIIHFIKKQNNVEAFINSHIRLIILFCRQYFLQDVFVRFYFLVKVTAGKVSINFKGDEVFHILLLLSDQMLFMMDD